MVRFKDYCVGCTSMGLPCRGSACPNINIEVHYCDKCGRELYFEEWDEGEEYCKECQEDEQP